jgi:hypothetical protein
VGHSHQGLMVYNHVSCSPECTRSVTSRHS